MLKRIWLPYLIGIMVFCSNLAFAHEFWLEPEQYLLSSGQALIANARVGENFKGDSYAYLPSYFTAFDLSINGKTSPISSVFGSTPPVNQTVDAEGLAILSFVSTVRRLEYDDPEKFPNFLKKEGLDWVLPRHQKKGLPASGFVEAYYRYAKSLVQIGDAQGHDEKLGLRFEWVLEENPYKSNKHTVSARLYWQGKPKPETQVSVFKRSDDQVERIVLSTDTEGYVSIPTEQDAEYLVNAVHMTEPSKETLGTEKTKDAVWESHWASVTFMAKSAD
jgi:uncharacterized GH25 family protein